MFAYTIDLQETPTTRSIRYLNDFHINTPQNARDQLETTPKKANYFANRSSGGGASSTKKKRNPLGNIRWSLDKSSQSSIFESIDENFENIFNAEASKACNQSIGVSPIKPHNISNANIHLPEKTQCIQRHPSGIESSTPKNNFKRIRTQSIVKPSVNLIDELKRDHLIRKTQSFSPSKRSALRETNFQHFIQPNEAHTNMAVESNVYNPARKVLEFTSQNFERLIGPSSGTALAAAAAAAAAATTPIKSNPHKDQRAINDGSTTPKTIGKHTPLKRLHIKQSRLVKEFSRKKITRSVTIRQTPSKAVASLNESDILAALADENETETKRKNEDAARAADTDENLMDISDLSASSSIKTPRANRQHLGDTPTRNEFVKQNIREEANRTPAKRFQKSTSYNFLSVKSSPEKEKFDIVYGNLPCTPPKNRQRRSLKRPAAAIRTDSPLAADEPSAKRNLFSESRRMYYNGMKQPLDILSYFQKVDKPEMAERILEYLPDKDLQTVWMVCKAWRKFIDENPKFKLRRHAFIKSRETIKENLPQRFDNKPNQQQQQHNHHHHYNNNSNSSKSISFSCSIINNNNNNNTLPLHVHNNNSTILAEKPVVVSPSKRRFEEHQQVTIQFPKIFSAKSD